jgi:hypothetical protein
MSRCLYKMSLVLPKTAILTKNHIHHQTKSSLPFDSWGSEEKKHPSIKQLPSTPSGRKSSCRRHPRSARCPRSPLLSHVVHTAPHYSPSSPLCHGLINMQNSSGHPSTTPAAPVVPSKSLAQSPSSMLTPAAMPSKAKSGAAGQGGGG